MHRSRIILAVSALTLVFTVAACKSGPSDPASYRAAMKGMTPALTKLAMTTRDASTSGDPMQLSSRQVPALQFQQPFFSCRSPTLSVLAGAILAFPKKS